MKRKTATRGVRFGVTLTVEDIAESLLGELGHEEMHELIVYLDAQVRDWDFTKRLHKHFDKEMKKLAEEYAKWGANQLL